jgi:uncharacterized protein (TIRG00374 family)
LVTRFDFSVLGQLTLLELTVVTLISVFNTSLSVLPLYVLLSSYKRVTLKAVYLILTSSLTANYATPVRIGVPLRAYLYHKLLDIPYTYGSAFLALETFLVLALPTIFALFGIATMFTDVSLLLPLLLIGILAFLLFLVVIGLRPNLITRTVARLPVDASRIETFLMDFRQGFLILSPARVGVICLLYVVVYLSAALRLYATVHFLAGEIGFLDSCFIHRTAFVIGSVSLLPFGLGARDVSMAFLLAQRGVPEAIAASTTLIERIFATGWTSLLGIISLNILGLRTHMVPMTENQNAKSRGDRL